VGSKNYKESVKLRLIKIGRAIAPRQKSYSEQKLIQLALNYLQSRNYKLLLEHSKSYTPIPKSYIKKIIPFLINFSQHLKTLPVKTERGCPFNEFSCS
jgi:radical SAM superfamily enzyme YgiQ (UPF0313 family)